MKMKTITPPRRSAVESDDAPEERAPKRKHKTLENFGAAESLGFSFA